MAALRRWWVEDQEFTAILSYSVSSRPAWATWDLVSENSYHTGDVVSSRSHGRALAWLQVTCPIPSTSISHITQIAMYPGLPAWYPEVSSFIPWIGYMLREIDLIICSNAN